MKTLKYILLAIVALAGFTACSDDAAEIPSGISGKGVYFPVNVPETVMIAEGQNLVSIPVMRSESEGAFDTRVLFSPGEEGAEIFTANTLVRFADGETTANVEIAFDFNDIEAGTKYAVSLALADETNLSSYGNTLYSFTILYDPWDDLGKATFYDNFFFMDGYEVPVQRKTGTTDQFRLVDPYGPGLKAEGADLVDLGLTVGEPSEYLEFQLLENGLVYFSPCSTGLAQDGAEILIAHPFNLGSEDPSEWTYSCELSEGVYQLAPFYFKPSTGSGWDHSQEDGYILIVMEGADLSDYSIESDFLGTYTSPDQSEMSALIDVKIGGDVASYKYAVAEGDLTGSEEDLMTYALGIAGGEIVSKTGTESETLRIALDYGGEYTFVAVSFDAQGGAQNFTYTMFEYVTGSRLTPDQFTAEIAVPEKDECSATIQIKPVASYLAYDWGIATKEFFDDAVKKSGSWDKYRVNYLKGLAEKNEMTMAELLVAVGAVNKGTTEETIEDMPSETDLIVWAYAIDTATGEKLSDMVTYEFKTDPMPELLPEYEKWIGVWTVTSTSSWQSLVPSTFNIVIDIKKANRSYQVYEWGPNIPVVEAMWEDYVPFIADFKEGGLEISSQIVASLSDGGNIALIAISNEVGSVFTQIGIPIMNGVLTGDTTARFEGASEQIAGFDYFIITSSSIGYIDTLDSPVGPYSLVKQDVAETASVKKAGRSAGDFSTKRLRAELRKNAGRRMPVETMEASESLKRVSGNSIAMTERFFSKSDTQLR